MKDTVKSTDLESDLHSDHSHGSLKVLEGAKMQCWVDSAVEFISIFNEVSLKVLKSAVCWVDSAVCFISIFNEVEFLVGEVLKSAVGWVDTAVVILDRLDLLRSVGVFLAAISTLNDVEFLVGEVLKSAVGWVLFAMICFDLSDLFI